MGKKGKSRKSKDGQGDSGFGFSPYLQLKGMSYSPDKQMEARKVRREARDEIDDALNESDIVDEDLDIYHVLDTDDAYFDDIDSEMEEEE